MGFFSKVWKGLKKGVKSIGKGIKSAFKKFGKFMNKIGVLGQIAMMFILPGIGQALGSMWTGIAGQTAAQGAAAASAAGASAAAGATAAATATGATAAAATAAGTAASQAAIAGMTQTATGLAGYTGAMSGVINGAGNMMRFVSSTVGKAGTVFNNITQGVTETLTNFAKTAGKKLGFKGDMFANAADNFFGAGNSATGTVTDSAFSRSVGEASRFGNLTQSESFFTARDAQYEKAFKATADEASKVITDAPVKSTDMQASTTTDSNFRQTSMDTAPKISNDPLSDLSERQMNDYAAQVTDKEWIDQGFSLKGEMGDIEYKMGDKNWYASPENLSKMDNSQLFESFQTGEMRGSAFSEGVKDLGQNFLDLPKNMYNEGRSFLSNPLEGATGKLQNKAVTRVAQEMGLEEKPVYNQYSFGADIPEFQTADVGTYGAPELMNARSFEQQVSNNPMAFGYTAFQYNGYMNQTNQYSNTTV